jgi:hypothetical protein
MDRFRCKIQLGLVFFLFYFILIARSSNHYNYEITVFDIIFFYSRSKLIGAYLRTNNTNLTKGNSRKSRPQVINIQTISSRNVNKQSFDQCTSSQKKFLVMISNWWLMNGDPL